MADAIKSLIFFDIEGTGLPYIDGPAKIVEISFVACSVDHFVSSVSSVGQEVPQIPRVLHKLSFCVNPFKRICEESSRITGLDNYKVEHETKLGVRELEMIKMFVGHLQQPACLVAHNGNAYDYLLLKREFIKHQVDIPENLLCVDSLQIFRQIDKKRDKEKQEDEELAEFIENELKEIEAAELVECGENSRVPNVPQNTQMQREPEETNSYDILEKLSSNVQQINETTPKRPTNTNIPHRPVRNKSGKSPQETPEKPEGGQENNHKSRKQLFPVKRTYRLCDIYRRFYGVDPVDTHRAESDCFILMQCALKEAREFLVLSQTTSKLFRDNSFEKCV